MSPRWEGILIGDHPLGWPYRAGRRVFGLLPSPWRCKFCNAPFRGPYAGAVKRIGYAPSRKNPQVCARCIERAPEGGAIVPLAILFADVRGYTSLCEQLAAAEVHEFLQRFYQTASAALLAQEGLLGQIAGDEVMALFVPGIAGGTTGERPSRLPVRSRGPPATPTPPQAASRLESASPAVRNSSATWAAAATRISRR